MTDKPTDSTQKPLHELGGIAKLLEVMRSLREPVTGCQWDAAQTYATITKYTIEEMYEVVEAIELQDMAALKDELGDLLFQIVFYAQIGSDEKRFTFDEIAQAAADKMIERHPHVFAGKKLADTEALMKMWEADKAHKREQQAQAAGRLPSALDDVATTMPALTRAIKLQNRAARVGFEWKHLRDVFAKLDEELAELNEVVQEREKVEEPIEIALVERLTEELGDVLFVIANIGRKLRIDPELALRLANRKFERRFHSMEAALNAKGQKMQDVGLEEQLELWQQAKKGN